jgi:hypothetical protein
MNKFYTIEIIKTTKEELDIFDIDDLFEILNKKHINSCESTITRNIFVEFIISLHKNDIKFIYNYKIITEYFNEINQQIHAKFTHPTRFLKYHITGIDEMQIYDGN